MARYQYTFNDCAPLTPLRKPLALCTVALVSSGGVYVEGQPPFADRDDLTYRDVPTDTAAALLRIHHLGYDHADAGKDVNCVMPLGHSMGVPFDAALQRAIVTDALNALTAITTPGAIIDLPYSYPPDPGWETTAGRGY